MCSNLLNFAQICSNLLKFAQYIPQICSKLKLFAIRDLTPNFFRALRDRDHDSRFPSADPVALTLRQSVSHSLKHPPSYRPPFLQDYMW